MSEVEIFLTDSHSIYIFFPCDPFTLQNVTLALKLKKSFRAFGHIANVGVFGNH